MSAPAQTLAHELYQLVNELDPLPMPGSQAAEILARRCNELLEAIQRLRDSTALGRERLAAALERVAGSLKALAQSLPTAPDFSLNESFARGKAAAAKHLREARSRLMDGYEQFLSALRAARVADTSELPKSLRPRNYARNLFHIGNAVLGVVLYEWFLDRTGCMLVLGGMLAVYTTLEIVRRLVPRVDELLYHGPLSALSRPRERYKVPAAIWYSVAVLIVVAFASQTAAQIAVLVVGFGDPAAALCGKRWGRRRILGRKTWVGTIAFVLVATLAGTIFLAATRPMALLPALGIAMVGAFAGAAAEVVSDDRLDDNFTVPIVAGLALLLVV